MLERDELDRLQDILESVRDKNGGPIPYEQVVALSAEDRLRAGVTIDFQASDVLGAPLVFLHHSPAQADLKTALRMSPAELRVARLVAAGLSNKEIALRLGISIGTVKDHVHHICRRTICRTELRSPPRSAVRSSTGVIWRLRFGGNAIKFIVGLALRPNRTSRSTR